MKDEIFDKPSTYKNFYTYSTDMLGQEIGPQFQTLTKRKKSDFKDGIFSRI